MYDEWDVLLDRAVAVKELRPSLVANEMLVCAFLSKAQSMLDVSGQHLLAIYRVDSARNPPAFIRELADQTLEASPLSGPRSPEEVEEILRQVLMGLALIHGRRLVHGSIKPQNIFRCLDLYKIGDFGLPTIPGVPTALEHIYRYTAPEVLQGEASSPASDIYSVGLIAYELLLGRIGFEQQARVLTHKGASSADHRAEFWPLIHTSITELPALHELIPGVPTALSLTLQQMMRKDPLQRMGNVQQALAALPPSGYARGRTPALHLSRSDTEDVTSRPSQTSQPKDETHSAQPTPRGWDIRHNALALMAVVLALVLASSAGYLLGRRRTPESAPLAQPLSPQPRSKALQKGPPVPIPPLTKVNLVPARPPNELPLPASKYEESKIEPANELKVERPASEATVSDKVRNGSAGSSSDANLFGSGDHTAISTQRPEILSGKQPTYFEVGTLHSGERVYMDLDSVFERVPADQEGLSCIRTAYGDMVRNLDLAFELNQEAWVYVGHDRRIQPKPNWLYTFEKTGKLWTVIVTDPSSSEDALIYYDVFARSYPAGRVKLGPNMALVGRIRPRKAAMYLVCVESH